MSKSFSLIGRYLSHQHTSSGRMRRIADSAVSMSLYRGKVLLSFAAILPCLTLCFLQGSHLVRPFFQGRCCANHEGLDLGMMLRKQPVIIAVIRGVNVDRAVELAVAAYDAGFKMISVTVDSPEYPRALHTMAEALNVKAADDHVMLGVSSATMIQQVSYAPPRQENRKHIYLVKLQRSVLWLVSTWHDAGIRGTSVRQYLAAGV